VWNDPDADGCIYDTVDCYHDCNGCHVAYPHFGGEYPEPEDDEETFYEQQLEIAREAGRLDSEDEA